MPNYQYQGRDSEGKKVSGRLEAENTGDAANFLADKNIIPTHIEIAEQRKSSFGFLFRSSTAKPQEILSFYRQMATLLGAGITVVKAVKQLAQSSVSRPLRNALDAIFDAISSGQTLAASMALYPKMFSKIEIGIIEIGENTGRLQEIFLQVAEYLENKILNRKRLLAATRYPAIVIIAVVTAIIVLNIFVIPKFASLFSRFQVQLPLPTRVLIAVSTFMQHNWVMVLIIAVLLLLLIPYILAIKQIRYFYDHYKLYFPVLGNLEKRILLSQFTWALGLILRAGLPVLKGMTLVAEASDNVYMHEKITKMRDFLDQGENFTQSMIRSGLFHSSIIQMVEVGESSGKLDEILNEIANYYNREIDYDIKRLNDLLEPLLLLVVGGMVLILALSIYLPMWDMVKFAKIG
ncbi:MAG: type II secretion system F family protein [Gammaproteobacteria bacterium]|nr:type II secretion system F family protein [Gammaproteobacteria bacterium]